MLITYKQTTVLTCCKGVKLQQPNKQTIETCSMQLVTGFWPWLKCLEADANWKYCGQSSIQTHPFCHSEPSTLTIILFRLPDTTSLSTPTYLRDSLPERSVQTIAFFITFKWFPSISCLMLTIAHTHMQSTYIYSKSSLNRPTMGRFREVVGLERWSVQGVRISVSAIVWDRLWRWSVREILLYIHYTQGRQALQTHKQFVQEPGHQTSQASIHSSYMSTCLCSSFSETLVLTTTICLMG